MAKLNKTQSALVGLQRYTPIMPTHWSSPPMRIHKEGEYVSARAAAKVINELKGEIGNLEVALSKVSGGLAAATDLLVEKNA